MKRTHGAAARAAWNIWRTNCNVSPAHIEVSSAPLYASTARLVSPAIARAISVFPVPGGPYKIAPAGGATPSPCPLAGSASRRISAWISARVDSGSTTSSNLAGATRLVSGTRVARVCSVIDCRTTGRSGGARGPQRHARTRARSGPSSARHASRTGANTTPSTLPPMWRRWSSPVRTAATDSAENMRSAAPACRASRQPRRRAPALLSDAHAQHQPAAHGDRNESRRPLHPWWRVARRTRAAAPARSRAPGPPPRTPPSTPAGVWKPPAASAEHRECREHGTQRGCTAEHHRPRVDPRNADAFERRNSPGAGKDDDGDRPYEGRDAAGAHEDGGRSRLPLEESHR